ncbi:MAG: peptidylprolyl isomerase [Thermoanaerobaculia bacterium]
MPRALGRFLAVAALLYTLPLTAQAPAPKAPKKETKVSKTRDYAHTLAVLKTSQGDVTLRFFYDKAPNHVKNFLDLAAKGFYDATLFHRVIPEFMIQGGDPNTKKPETPETRYGTGNNRDEKGQPVYIKAEFNDTAHRRGILSMARSSNPDSASSQFFICVKDSPFLDRQYTAFGEVAGGLDVLDKIVVASNYDPTSGGAGKPRSPQKLLKVELVDEAGAAPAKN